MYVEDMYNIRNMHLFVIIYNNLAKTWYIKTHWCFTYRSHIGNFLENEMKYNEVENARTYIW